MACLVVGELTTDGHDGGEGPVVERRRGDGSAGEDQHHLTPEQAAEEAIQRIEQAAKDGRWWLDLGDLPILAVPEEIARLKEQLQVLSLGRYRLLKRGQSVQWEYDERRVCPISGLHALAGLASLTSLDLTGCKG